MKSNIQTYNFNQNLKKKENKILSYYKTINTIHIAKPVAIKTNKVNKPKKLTKKYNPDPEHNLDLKNDKKTKKNIVIMD